MLEKTITFTDFKGNVRTRQYYFHLSKPEIIELDVEVGGLQKFAEKISLDNDKRAAADLFNLLIRRSYGVVSEDGVQHVKSDEITRSFLQSPAYEVLYMELLQDPSGINAIDFFTSVIPVEEITALEK